MPFGFPSDVERDDEGKEELALPDDPGLELDLIVLSGGPDRSPSAFRFVPLLVLIGLLTAGLLTSLVASAAGFVRFAGKGF